MPIRALVFDIGGVLELGHHAHAEPTASLDDLINHWESRLGLSGGELGRYLDRRRGDALVGAYALSTWHEELRAVAGMNGAQLEAFLADFWDVYLGRFNQELADHLRRLRASYKTALLSNSCVGAREKEQERFGMGDLADVIVYSHEEGIAKPDRRIYEITCERLGVRPAEAVFLDDVPSYVEGARAVGMLGIRYVDNDQAMAAIRDLLQD